MYCEHCGKEISKIDKFCEHCGAPQEAPQNVTTEIPMKTAATFNEWIRGHKKLLLIGVLSIVVIVGILMGIDYAKTFINPLKYLTVEMTGYNGQSDVNLYFDEGDELTLKLLGEKAAALDLELDENATEEMALMVLGTYFQLAEEMDQIQQIFAVNLEQTEESAPIQNGDTLTVTIAVNQEALKAYGFRTTKESYTKTYVVGKDTSSLPEPTKLDIFSVLDLTIDGADSYGLLINSPIEKVISYDAPIDDYHSVRICVEQNEYQVWQPYVRLIFLDETNEQVASYGIEIKAEKTEGFTNGEKIVISILEREAESLRKFGLILQETEKTITASGLRATEELDLLGLLDCHFGGPDGYAYIQITPGTYTIPIQNPENPDKEITVEVLEDENYDVHKQYNGRPNVPLEFVVHPAANVESKVRIVIYAEPYDKLSNGDVVNFGIYESPSRDGIKRLNAAGFTIKSGRTVEVTGLPEPIEFKLSEVLDYSVNWDEENNMVLSVGTTKTVELPDNALGIKQFVTTLGEKDSSYNKYPVTFEVTTVDETGKEEIHKITDDIYIQKDSWYDQLTFDVVAERSLRELRDFGIVIAESYEVRQFSPESE